MAVILPCPAPDARTGTPRSEAGHRRRTRSVASPSVLDVRIADHVTPLVGALAELLADAPPDPFAPEWVAVPSIGMRRWLAQRLGRELGTSGSGRADGVTANVELP